MKSKKRQKTPSITTSPLLMEVIISGPLILNCFPVGPQDKAGQWSNFLIKFDDLYTLCYLVLSWSLISLPLSTRVMHFAIDNTFQATFQLHWSLVILDHVLE